MAITLNTNPQVANGGYTINTTGSSGTINLGAGNGAYLTSTGASATTYTTAWASANSNFTNSNGVAVMTMPYGEDKIIVDKKATLDVKGTLVVNGVDLEERLKTIETLLNIPTRDVTMEAKYPKLKQLYEQYMQELEKYKTWDRLNDE